MVKHANWLLNRYLIHEDGRTSLERRWGKASALAVTEFGETVLFRVHGRHHVNKADAAFNPGIWLGRETDSGEHLIGTSSGAAKTRSIRRLAPSERWQTEIFSAFKGVPWNPRLDGKFEPSFIFGGPSNLSGPDIPPVPRVPEGAEQPSVDQPSEPEQERPPQAEPENLQVIEEDMELEVEPSASEEASGVKR